MSDTNTAITIQDDAFFDRAEIPQGFKKAIGVVQVAMGNLGFLHRKFFNIAVANAYEGLGQGKLKFRISASTLAECAEFSSHNYQAIYDAFEDLRQAQVRRIQFDQKSKRRRRKVGSSGLLAEFDIIEGGVIEYSFSPEMAKILYQPDEYIWLTLAVQNRFSSKYELSLWENCIRYVGVGSTGFKPVEEWRAILGAEDEYYDTFKHLNQKVLKPSVSGVNEKSGILLEPEFRREKRRVSELRFDVKENPQLSLLDHNEHQKIRATEAFKGARELGLKDVEVIYWIETRGEDYVTDAVSYVRSRKEVSGTRGYLINALHKGYAEKSPLDKKRIKEAKAAANERTEREAERKRIEDAATKVKDRYQEKLDALGESLFAQQDDREKQALLKALGERSIMLSSGFIRDRWRGVRKDVSQLKAADRTDLLILHEIARGAVETWGGEDVPTLKEFCEAESVEVSVVAYLERSKEL